MKIQRERFWLVAGLVTAVAACTAKATSNPSGDAGAPMTDAGATHDSAPATYDAGHDAGPVIEVGDADLLGGWDGSCLANGGGDFTNCSVYGTVVPEGGAPITDYDGGPPCVTFNFCESLSALDTAVAAQALACETRDFTPGCVDTTPCVLAALSVACSTVDAGAATTCAPVVAACADAGTSDGGPGVITAAACEQVVSGFNSSTLLTLVNCMSTSCNIPTCVGQLF